MRLPTSPAEQLHSASRRWHLPPRLRRSAAPGMVWRRLLPPMPNAGGGEADEDVRATRDPRLARLEAVLFLAREPLAARKLSQFAGLEDGTAARTLIRRLNLEYDERGRAFRIEDVAGGYQLLSRPKFARWLRRLAHVPVETRLSAPALETLAVVAYRQPVPRAEVEAVRGVSCGEILRVLLERDLVRIGGRSEELGRPYLYCTTRRFMQTFGLRSLDELPRGAALRKTSRGNGNGPAEAVKATSEPKIE
jgi:segregation and condensation protein B